MIGAKKVSHPKSGVSAGNTQKRVTGLKLNGKALELGGPKPVLQKIAAWLDSKPADELFSTEELASVIGIGRCSIQHFYKESRFAEYCHFAPGAPAKWYLGNPRAIVSLKQLLAENGK